MTRVGSGAAISKAQDAAQALAVMPVQGGDHLVEDFALFGFVGHLMSESLVVGFWERAVHQ
jgi:hypothetical protein